MDAVTRVPSPSNEPVLSYAPGSRERLLLTAKLTVLASEPVELPHVIGGVHRQGSGERVDVVQPHRHSAVLGTLTNATHEDADAAVEAAVAAAPGWRALSFDDRAAVLLRAADLLSGPWRETLAAATMLGQSKSVQQAEIDAPCELIDFWRFNVHFARQILADQPVSGPGVWNRLEYRPLEGFVYAITPFNFSAIAGNLPTAPALMGNTVVWKPATTQTLAAYWTMKLLEEAGLPPGVINLVTGSGAAVSDVALGDPRLAGIHFTGSTKTFQHLWREVAGNIDSYHGYPRLVGETGGKDFVVAHSSANPDVLRTALVRGAFEYQGQKCSAASRAYVPKSVWQRMGDAFLAEVDQLSYGDVTDLSNFGGALIDRAAYDKNVAAIERARGAAGVTIPVGGKYDDSEGYFVRPTVLLVEDPRDESFATEYFGPILSVHVYDDDPPGAFDDVLGVVDSSAPYALTGSVIADDRVAVDKAGAALRFAAGNFYVNDKPTGAVVGQQPFGGARASGTNDKAGSPINLLRWTSARTIKETFVPPTDHRYPHMEPEE
ncbi:L-glutamate gamma-semialdehyde dehydrogenase [Rhodococcus daqingensis]|uniref:L-glutamate gamma-semialdehyde dehydrogenase n=1 Tax=Rhodococcus daqingensis TaxID=2479363 RepID=A0ABW2RXP4_9NOCA